MKNLTVINFLCILLQIMAPMIAPTAAPINQPRANCLYVKCLLSPGSARNIPPDMKINAAVCNKRKHILCCD